MLSQIVAVLALISGISADLHGVVKRQNASFTIHDPGNGMDSLKSLMPLQCIAGCFHVGGYYSACAEVANEEPCTWLCGATNYTTWVQCLNCVVANGEQDVTPADMSTVLQNTNSYCANVNGFAPTSAITATPTTTGPFESDFTVASTATGRHPDLTFPIWTGLATLADPNFYSDLNAEIDSRASATFSIDPSDTPVIVGHGSPTGSLAAGSVTQSTVSRSMVEGPTIGQGSAGASSAAATTSGAASRVMEGAKMGGVAGMILGVVLA